jgi:capsular exopolysaccharide synthesis family protein
MRIETSFPGERRSLQSERDPGARRHDALTVVTTGRGYAEMPPAQDAAPGGGIDFGSLLRTLLRRSPIIVAMAVVGALAGVKLTSMIKPVYTSSVSVLLEPKRSDSVGSDTLFGSVMVDTTKIASVVSLIESSDLLTRVMDAQKLEDDPEFGDPPVSIVRKWFGFLPFLKAPPVRNDLAARRERALGVLERAVRVDRVGYTYVLTIEARAARPETARRVAAAVADGYLNDQVERNTASRQRDTVWLAQRLTDARRDLAQSEQALDAVRQKYGLRDLGSGATVDRQALIAGLNTQLAQAQADVATLRARYEQAERARASGGSLEGLAEAATSAEISGLRTTEATLTQKLADLSAVYNDTFPDITRLKESLRTVQGQIATAVSRIVEVRHNEYDAAVARQRALSEQLQAAIANDGGTSGDEGREQVRDAQRIVDANRGLYDSLVNRWREVQQQQVREEPEARIISEASLPAVPSSPKPMLLPVGGGAAMLFLGLGLTLVPVFLENRFVSVTAVEQRLRLPVLGAIPMLRRRDLAVARRRRSIVEYTSRRPLSRFAESLRMLRAHLHISPDGACSIVQVTSAVAGEGKSTVAGTLAVSAASAGVRTVLIDADVRTSSVSAMFGLRHEEGLSDILELGVPARSILQDRDDMPLAVLGAGSSLLPRPDIIDSKRFLTLLRELSESYSLIILDSPPVLPVSDALVLSKYADATILVVQWRATPKAVAEQAVKVLRTVNAALAGVMLNKIDLSKVSQYECGYSEYGRTDGKPH